MVSKFNIPCIFQGSPEPKQVTVYVGAPETNHHPLHFQADWLGKMRGGSIPQDVMDSFQKLKDLADKNGVSFEELCVYAIRSASEGENFDETDTTQDNMPQDGDASAQIEAQLHENDIDDDSADNGDNAPLSDEDINSLFNEDK